MWSNVKPWSSIKCTREKGVDGECNDTDGELGRGREGATRGGGEEEEEEEERVREREEGVTEDKEAGAEAEADLRRFERVEVHSPARSAPCPPGINRSPPLHHVSAVHHLCCGGPRRCSDGLRARADCMGAAPSSLQQPVMQPLSPAAARERLRCEGRELQRLWCSEKAVATSEESMKESGQAPRRSVERNS